MKRLLTTLTAALAAAIPAAAEDTGFDFDAWFMGLSRMDVPEVGIRLGAKFAGHFEANTNTQNSLYPIGVLFRVYIKNGSNTSGRPLTVDVSWTTATGLAGHGSIDGTLPVIGVNASESTTFSVLIPDDDIAHSCNKLIVHVRSLTPDLYRAMPYARGQGFEYVVYLDNDGGNPVAGTSDGQLKAAYERLTRYCN